jgi:competence protein ComFC
MSILAPLRRITETVASLFYPPHCAECGASTQTGVFLCPACAGGALKIEAPFCRQCSQPFEGDITGEFRCSNCDGRKFHFECAIAKYRSKGVVRDFIHRLKYERAYYLRKPLAEWAAVGLTDKRVLIRPFDFFVPVPLHPTRKRERGFNQAEAIGTVLASRAGKPMVNALRRTRYTTTQTRLDRAERMENLRGAFVVRKPDAVRGRNIILVDDVFTTGSTIEECARVLREADAASVRALTVARG